MDPGPFERLLVELSRAEVRYLVVGGIACVLNGFVRTTEVVDLLVDNEPDNLRRLLDVLGRLGEGHARELRVEDFPVDIFTRMGGRRYADMLRYRAVREGADPIPYVNAEGLILMKSGSPRPQDKIDVETLRRL